MFSKHSLGYRLVLCIGVVCLLVLCLTACSRNTNGNSVFAHTRSTSTFASSTTEDPLEDSSENQSTDSSADASEASSEESSEGQLAESKEASSDASSEQTDSGDSDSADGEEAESESSSANNEDESASADGQTGSADSTENAQSSDGQDTSEAKSNSTDGQTSKDAVKKNASADGQELDLESLDLSEVKEKGTVLVLDMSAGVSNVASQDGEADSSANSKSATKLKAELLTKKEVETAFPELDDATPIAVLRMNGIDSASLTGDMWIDLAKLINKAASNSKIGSFVVVQGTDTFDETAYFLNLTVKTDKAVVVMSASQSSDYDLALSTKNLSQAIIAASDSDSSGKGVLEILQGSLYASRDVHIASDDNGDCIAATDEGSLGSVHASDAEFYAESQKTHTLKSTFDVDIIESLPRVSIVQLSVDADARLVSDAASHSDGLVVVAATDGSLSEDFKEAIDQCTIPVVVCSGADGAFVAQDSLPCKQAVAANNLSPQKAAVLLRLALTKTTNHDTLEEIFAQY